MPLDTPFKCPHCDQTFARESGLESHLQRIHNDHHQVVSGRISPEELDASLSTSRDQLRWRLQATYLEFRYGHGLTAEDIRMLVNLEALAETYHDPLDA